MDSKAITTKLEKLNGSTFAGIDTITTVPLLGGKKNPMQGRVQKVVKGANILLTSEPKYATMTMNKLKKAGKNPANFKLGARAWGTRRDNMPIVDHIKKGTGEKKEYLEAVFIHHPKKVTYLLDGKPIEKAEIEGLKRSSPIDPEKVIIRTYDFESITDLRFEIADDTPTIEEMKKALIAKSIETMTGLFNDMADAQVIDCYKKLI